MLLINTFLLLVIDIYIYFALRGTTMRFAYTKAFPYLWWGYSLLLFTALMISFNFQIPQLPRSIILVLFFITAVSKFLYLPFIILDEIRRGGTWIYRLLSKKKYPNKEETEKKPQTKSPVTRSEFLMKSGIFVASLPILPLSWGVISSAYDYKVIRKKLYLPNLPKAFHGFKIAQVSDIHSGSFYNKKAVQGGVEMLLNEKPDAIFFTGDLVNNRSNEMYGYQDIFSKLKARFGVYSVLGNHDYGEYYYGFEDSPEKQKNLKDLIETHKVMGWDLLMDEHRKIKVDNEELCIAGVQNWGAGRFPKKGDLQKALKGTEEQPVKLLLSHDPSHWRAQVLSTDVDVMFAGHTHGMQFGVRTKNFQWSPAQYVYDEWAGLYQEKHQKLYVNVGYGFLGYPGRVGILPEITLFELISGEERNTEV